MSVNLDIGHLTTQERLDLIGELWDSLMPHQAILTPAQEADLIRRMVAFDLQHDAWAKPYIDEAVAEIENGKFVTLEEHETRMAALMAKICET